MGFFQSESHEEYVDIEGYEDDENAQATKAVLDTSLAQDLQLTPENSDDEDRRPSTPLYCMPMGRGNIGINDWRLKTNLLWTIITPNIRPYSQNAKVKDQRINYKTSQK